VCVCVCVCVRPSHLLQDYLAHLDASRLYDVRGGLDEVSVARCRLHLTR
jgi:hypothetical protein